MAGPLNCNLAENGDWDSRFLPLTGSSIMLKLFLRMSQMLSEHRPEQIPPAVNAQLLINPGAREAWNEQKKSPNPPVMAPFPTAPHTQIYQTSAKADCRSPCCPHAAPPNRDPGVLLGPVAMMSPASSNHLISLSMTLRQPSPRNPFFCLKS